ncbi:hypothetical protein JOJ87_005099 [Rhodococcus ruber]|uniref:hypothetical protein n=1 Tax=Rhodococcus ruber TaxID=1830 RepID=UPI001AEA7672|nr:hypothetical protein [Rhodococcus ruber]MBP2214687.1 hypothetical protein [Rhodococcus ruber]
MSLWDEASNEVERAQQHRTRQEETYRAAAAELAIEQERALREFVEAMERLRVPSRRIRIQRYISGVGYGKSRHKIRGWELNGDSWVVTPTQEVFAIKDENLTIFGTPKPLALPIPDYMEGHMEYSIPFAGILKGTLKRAMEEPRP